MSAGDWVSFVGAAIKLVAFLLEKYRKTPLEKRRESLAEFDKAIDKARSKNDLGDLSKWLGKNL